MAARVVRGPRGVPESGGQRDRVCSEGGGNWDAMREWREPHRRRQAGAVVCVCLKHGAKTAEMC